ncbi:MAG: hypothetical protein KF906_05040 [Actinobacteria bacterium]|nr:hypothetical protein [Actinomycetota bacterium]
MPPGPDPALLVPIAPVERASGTGPYAPPPVPGTFGPASMPSAVPAPVQGQRRSNSITTGLVAGVIGGMLGFALSNLQGDLPLDASKSDLNLYSAWWTALIGAGMAPVMAAWSSATSGASEQAVRRAGLGVVIGGAAGFAGGYLGQMLYTSMLEGADTYEELESTVLQARVLGWGLFGAFLGLGVGILFGPRRVFNGLVGGAIGGAAGGFVFQKISESATDDTGPQFWGIVAIGLAIGVAVGVMDRLLRQFWLQGLTGPLRGRELILFKLRTTIGSAAGCDIVIANDPEAHPTHAALEVQGQTMSVQPLGPVLVDGVPAVGQTVVRSGQVLTIGRSTFTVGQRAASSSAPFR